LDLVDEFRTRAAECLRLAENAHTLPDQTMWLDMAQLWLRLSEHAREQDSAPSGAAKRQRPDRNGDENGNGKPDPQKPKA